MNAFQIRKVFLILLLFVSSQLVFSITFKIASTAPKGSDWDKALKSLAEAWAELSDGQIKLKIYSGGVAGDEPQILSKMRIGQLHGGIITGSGLIQIDPNLLLLSLPRFITSNDELQYLLNNIGDDLDSIFENKDFKLVGWQLLGWAHIFSTKDIEYPDDLKSVPLADSTGNSDIQRVWQNMGIQVVPLTLTDLMLSLQTGRVGVIYTAPIIAASYQLFGIADHMSPLPLAPVVAALVFSEKAWEKIPEKYHEALLAETAAIMEPVIEISDDMAVMALDIMTKNGLQVEVATSEMEQSWDKLISNASKFLIGDVINPDLYWKAKQFIDEYRQTIKSE